jgi:carboxyl-terminal processing protease
MKTLNAETIRNVILVGLLMIVSAMAGHRLATNGISLSPMDWISGKSGVRPGASALSQLVNTDTGAKKNVNFGIFWEVWGLLEKDYVDPSKIDADKMVNGAIGGMTASLEDPYTMYLPPVDNQRSGEDLAGSFYGIGIELGYVDGVLAVITPLNGTPAQLAGLQAGDLILRIKDPSKKLDTDTANMSIDKAVNAIRGEKGTEVTLNIARKAKEGEVQKEPFDVSVKRGEIIVPSAELTFVESNGKRVAHLKLSRFGERTNGEWDSAVQQILKEKNNISGIVLDMRNNPGGFFDGAIDVASEFIPSGVVVSQQGRYSNQDYSVRRSARLNGIPVEVLVNRGSASASEIVAGALRDRLHAKLIGERTFGKGTVQDRRELSNGGGVHITVGKWLLPSGEWIHHEGIPVDVEVTNNPDTPEDEVLNKAIEVI